MLQEVTENICPKEGLSGKTFVDCTLGGAGHSQEIAKLLGQDGFLIGIDQDKQALEAASSRLNRIDKSIRPKIALVHGNFEDMDNILMDQKIPNVDAILMDLGMSSYQIDESTRGFSFKQNGPLDMRMDPTKQNLNAAKIVNSYLIEDLIGVLRNFSDEKFAKEIASEIVKARKIKPIETSFELVEIIKKAIPAPARRKGGHPAKRTFQALRIEVNKELQVLRKGLQAGIRWLSPKGKIVVISYHSLEDKIVKDFFYSLANRCTCPPDFPKCVCGKKPVIKVINKKAILTSNSELKQNSRSRSAKLRVAEKL